jgi:hypothetical protein
MYAQPPAAVEASVMVSLDSQDAAARAYFNTFPVGAASSAMANWIGGLGQVEWGYQRLRPACGWLEQQGWPRARQRLDASVGNLARNRDIYVGMYNDRVRVESTQAGIWQDAVRFGTSQVMAANAHQNAVAQNWVQGMFDVNEKRCYDCHRIIGLPGGGYCYDCARRRGWVY